MEGAGAGGFNKSFSVDVADVDTAGSFESQAANGALGRFKIRTTSPFGAISWSEGPDRRSAG